MLRSYCTSQKWEHEELLNKSTTLNSLIYSYNGWHLVIIVAYSDLTKELFITGPLQMIVFVECL